MKRTDRSGEWFMLGPRMPDIASPLKGAPFHVTAAAIAAFEAIQVAFVALVKKGILSKAEAEAALRKAIEVIKTETNGDQAAELLDGLSETVSSIQAAPRK
jgi:hypothetical protein